MNKIIKKIKKNGQSLIEYGLIVSLVAVVLIAVLNQLGNSWKDTINGLTERLDYANQLSQQQS